MADKFTIMKDWIDSIRNDENLGDVSEQEMAYIIYALVMYGLSGEKINIGSVFGGEFKYLNWAMPNILGQVDKIRGYNEKQGELSRKYDSEAIKKLRLAGFTAKQICAELGYPEDRSRSITSNRGWIEAGQKVRNDTDSVQKNTEICTDESELSQKSVRESVYRKSDFCTENTEKSEIVQKSDSESVQKSVCESVRGFDF